MTPELLLIEAVMPELEARLDAAYTVHRLARAADKPGRSPRPALPSCWPSPA